MRETFSIRATSAQVRRVACITWVWVLSFGCARENADNERTRLRDAARAVLERECGDCHVPESGVALPAALRVYNLSELEWAGQMSSLQLEKLSQRIVGGEREMFDPFDVRNVKRVPPAAPSATDVEVVQRYVRAELARRERAGHH